MIKLYLDEHGNLHGPECPATKEAWGEGIDVDASGTDCDGPAQFATESYRRNWDRVFGAKPVVGQA